MSGRINIYTVQEKKEYDSDTDIEELHPEVKPVFDYEKHKEEVLNQIKLYEAVINIKKMMKDMNIKPYSKTKIYQQEYYNENKSKKREDYYCNYCGKHVKYFSKATHMKSKTHKNNVANANAAAAKATD